MSSLSRCRLRSNNDCSLWSLIWKSCLKTGTCPLCRTRIVKTSTIGRIAREVYNSLVIKCAFDCCHKELTIDTYKSHERTCPKGGCLNCGCFRNEGHNCVQSLQQVIFALQIENVQLMAEADKWKRVINVSALVLFMWFCWTHRYSWAIGDAVREHETEEHVLIKAAKELMELFWTQVLSVQ